jgi:hypothetical protein
MKRNVITIDRILRIIIGLTLMGLAGAGIIGVWGWIGVIPLLTGSIAWCPLYTLIGFNACKSQA